MREHTILTLNVRTANANRNIVLRTKGPWHTLHVDDGKVGARTMKSSSATDIFHHLNQELALVMTEAATRMTLKGHDELQDWVGDVVGVGRDVAPHK